MKTLQLEGAYTVLRLTDLRTSPLTLTEEVAPYIGQSPNLILDVEDIQFTSMLIGEILNVHRAFDDHWQGEPHQVSLANLTDASRQVLRRVRLDELFPIFDSLADAVNGALITRPRSAGSG